MKRSFVRGFLVVASLCGMTIAGGFAFAAGDDRAVAETTLREIETLPKKDVAADFVARARASLERATRMRAAGDEAHARLSDRTARAWADAARDSAKAAETEESAATARVSATDAGLTADRERALLEEAIAQSGRLRAQLESAGESTKVAKTSTSAKNDNASSATSRGGGRDGGAPSGPAPAPKSTARDGGAP